MKTELPRDSRFGSSVHGKFKVTYCTRLQDYSRTVRVLNSVCLSRRRVYSAEMEEIIRIKRVHVRVRASVDDH